MWCMYWKATHSTNPHYWGITEYSTVLRHRETSKMKELSGKELELAFPIKCFIKLQTEICFLSSFPCDLNSHPARINVIRRCFFLSFAASSFSATFIWLSHPQRTRGNMSSLVSQIHGQPTNSLKSYATIVPD